MTHDTPHGQQPQPHHHQQEQHQQDFKQKLEALYSQSKSWFDCQQQNLDNLEAHQHNINQANLESVANIIANLQLTRNDVAFLRINIRTQDERIEELRTLIEKNEQNLAVQTETIAHLKQERASLISSKRTLYQRNEELEDDLAAMILRVETLERQLSRLKRHVREDKVAPGCNTVTTIAEEDRRAKEIQRILSTIHGYEAVHAYALEFLPPPSPDPLQDPSYQNQETTTPRSPPSPQSQPTIYFIADTPHEKPSLESLNIPAPISTSSTTPPLPFTFIPTTFNPANPFFSTTSPPPPSPPPPPPSLTATTTTTSAATATIATTAAGNTHNEIVTPASDIETLPFQNPRVQQPSPPPQPQFSPEKLLRLQRVHSQKDGHEAWMNQQNEQSQFLFQQFPHQDQVQDQWPRILRHPFTTSPQYARALVSLALSLWVSFLAYITIHIYSFILQPNQQYQQLEDPARVCETTYNTNSMSWMPLEGEFFIPT